MTLLTISFCSLALLGAAGHGQSPPAANHDAAQLRTRAARAQTRIKSLRVVYESRSYDASFPAGNYLHCELFVMEPHRCSFLTAHGNDALDWTDDPLGSRIYLSDQDWIMEVPVNRCYFSQAWDVHSPLPGSAEVLHQRTARSNGLSPFPHSGAVDLCKALIVQSELPW